MMNIESAAVFTLCFTAMATNLVALSNLSGGLLPCRVVNRVRIFAKIFPDIVVNILSAIPSLFTRLGTKPSPVCLAQLTTNFANWKRFRQMGRRTGARTVGSFIPEFALEGFTALLTNVRFILLLGLPVARPRAVFGITPFATGTGNGLYKGCATP